VNQIPTSRLERRVSELGADISLRVRFLVDTTNQCQLRNTPKYRFQLVVACIAFEKYVFIVAAGPCFLFSGLFFTCMRRDAVFLDLSPAALEERFPRNHRRWKWSDFDRFFVVDVPIQSENGGTDVCVGFLYSSSYDGSKEPSKLFASPHCDDTLRFLYGMKATELADLLNQWRSCRNTD